MTTDNNDEIAALKNQMFILLIALIVVSGTLTVTLYRQVSLTNKDITNAERVTAQMQTNEMVLKRVVGSLENYGSRHPEYQPVLKKNGFMPPTGTATTVAPTATPAPAAPKK